MRRRAVLCAGALALALGAVLAPHAPPLYDGIGFPDEPYRYAQVLADDPVKTPPPTTAEATLALTGGSNGQGLALRTAESGPQLLAYVPQGAVRATSARLVVSARPLAPGQPAPADGPVAGDVYRLAATDAATWHSGSNGTISLRSPQGIPVTPVMEFRAGGAQSWHALATTRVGNDIWEAPLGAFGDYALVLPLHRRPATTGGNTAVYLLAGGVALVAAALAGARVALRRRASAEPAGGEPSDPAADT